jgi:hypothetical protein
LDNVRGRCGTIGFRWVMLRRWEGLNLGVNNPFGVDAAQTSASTLT